MLTHTWKHQRTEQQGNSGTVSVGWVTTLQRHCRFVLNLPGDNCTCSTVILYRDSFPNPQQISQIHTMLFWDSCEPHWTLSNLFSKCLLTGFCFFPPACMQIIPVKSYLYCVPTLKNFPLFFFFSPFFLLYLFSVLTSFYNILNSLMDVQGSRQAWVCLTFVHSCLLCSEVLWA